MDEKQNSPTRLSAITQPSSTMILADASGSFFRVYYKLLIQALSRIRFVDTNGDPVTATVGGTNKTTVLFFDGHVSKVTEKDITPDTFNYNK